MVLSQYRYVYLGLIDLGSDNIVAIDPYINNISVLSEKISPYGFRSLRFSRVKKGSYNCYVLLNPDGNSKYLLILHENADVRDICDMNFEHGGFVSVSFGHAICICCEDSLYRTSDYGSGIHIYDEALFSVTQLRQKLQTLSLPDGDLCAMRLEDIIYNAKADYISGKDIKTAFAGNPVWTGFYQFNEWSTLWSCEVLHRIHDSSTNAVVLPGCAASHADPVISNVSECFICRNDRNKIMGVLANLL